MDQGFEIICLSSKEDMTGSFWPNTRLTRLSVWPDIGKWNRIELKLVSFVKPHHAYEVVRGKRGPIKCRFWDALHCTAP